MERMPRPSCHSRCRVIFTALTIRRYGEGTAMGILHIERRREPRAEIELNLIVWGVDTRGERFAQEARARDISLTGALLSGLTAEPRCGDVVGILYRKCKARYRVIWIRYDVVSKETLVAVHRLQADTCPWVEVLA